MWVNDGGVWLFVVQKEALDDGLMAITGESPIAKSRSLDGKVDLYGFQFDTGKAVLRDGSRTTLQELAASCKTTPACS
jgi:outer membrane protein OmpA-like peptidoglycan-associated protein